MTAEEIKKNTDMTDVLHGYGIEVRHGMCRCPFHGNDKHPSMQVFRDGCKCYTCNESWDIFSFVQKMDNCDFKTAYIALGGTYHYENSRERIIAKAKREAKKAELSRSRMVRAQLFHEVALALKVCQLADKVYPPLSDGWCELKNFLPLVEYYYDELFIQKREVKEVEDADVYRQCRNINRKFIPNEGDIRRVVKPGVRTRPIAAGNASAKEGEATRDN